MGWRGRNQGKLLYEFGLRTEPAVATSSSRSRSPTDEDEQ